MNGSNEIDENKQKHLSTEIKTPSFSQINENTQKHLSTNLKTASFKQESVQKVNNKVNSFNPSKRLQNCDEEEDDAIPTTKLENGVGTKVQVKFYKEKLLQGQSTGENPLEF